MAPASVLFAALLAAAAPAASAEGLRWAAAHSNTTAEIPVTQKVLVEGVEVYGQSAGFGQLNQCVSFPRSFVTDDTKPAVQVCGTQTKVTVFLRNRFEDYHTYQLEIGACDTTMDTEACATQGPSSTSWMSTAQTYKIEQCATGISEGPAPATPAG